MFKRRHRERLSRIGATQAPPLLVGEAVHKYCEVFINAWMEGPLEQGAAMEEALGAFNTIMGQPDPENIDMLEREQLARAVLPLWAARKWQRLDSGVEVPVATELELYIDLPESAPSGRPIHQELRRYTAKLDYVYQEMLTQYLVVSDHKTTKTTAPAKEVKHYMMSDQHVGYVACWNLGPLAEKYGQACKVEYSLTRLHPKVTSEHTFWDEPRNIDNDQIESWYLRMLELRADISAKWDMPDECWVSNTSPHGPCLGMDGRECEFIELCKQPTDTQKLKEQKYVYVEQGV